VPLLQCAISVSCIAESVSGSQLMLLHKQQGTPSSAANSCRHARHIFHNLCKAEEMASELSALLQSFIPHVAVGAAGHDSLSALLKNNTGSASSSGGDAGGTGSSPGAARSSKTQTKADDDLPHTPTFGFGSVVGFGSGAAASSQPAASASPSQVQAQGKDEQGKGRKRAASRGSPAGPAASSGSAPGAAPAAGEQRDMKKAQGRPKRDLGVAAQKVLDEFCTTGDGEASYTLWFGEECMQPIRVFMRVSHP
jgi:hypothetical protein